jgi:glutamine amidotransferase
VTRIAVLDYGIGNLRSAQKAFQHVGADARLTADPVEIEAADAVVLPGVGAFGPCMDALEVRGLDELARSVVDAGVPFLGICVGMQLLYDGSEEAPGRPGLGILRGTVRRLPDGVKRPQMQWNVLDVVRPTPVFGDLHGEIWVYFVHSYAPDDHEHAIAVCDYGGKVVAAVQHDSVVAMQFHPEKSGAVGLQILANFVDFARTVAV